MAFGLGIAAWFLIPIKAGWIAFLLASLGAAAVARSLSGSSRAAKAASIFLLFAALGCGRAWWRAEAVTGDPIARPIVATFEARIERSELLVARDAWRLTLAVRPGQDLPRRVRVNVDLDKMPERVGSGDRIALRARLVPPPGPALPGGYDFARVAWFKQLGATGRALDPIRRLPDGEAQRADSLLADMRERLTAHIRAQLPARAGGIAAALAAGDQGAIAEADAEAMRISGLAHLLSISGLHVGVVVGGTMLLVIRLLALSPRLALRWPLLVIGAAAAAVAGIAYTLLAGAEVPTIRACLSAILVLFALMLGREAITLRLLAAAGLLLLIFMPEALMGPSFQLSFAAVATIVALHAHPGIAALLARRDEGLQVRLARNVAGLLITGIAIEFALSPIALYHFHKAGVYGAIANLVAIPLTSFLIMPAEALALALDPLGLGAPFWWLAGQGIMLMLDLAHWIATLPGAVALLPTLPIVAFALMVSGGLWLLLWRERPRWLGLAPLAIGAVWAIMTPPADLLIGSDGRHVAIGTPEGPVLLRTRAGDYVRGTFAEAGGVVALGEIDASVQARCSADLCIFRVGPLLGLATRSAYHLDWATMVKRCAAVDIAISDRNLPKACHPRWLRLDRKALAQTGAVAITLSPLRIRTAKPPRDDHPWLRPPARAPSAGNRVSRP